MYIFTDGITEMKDTKGEMLGQEGFQNYIKKYQSVPNSQRLSKIIEDLIKSDRVQKDDLTIVTIDGN
jgi:sigma-B regulation protein RsbU (phosphoserine phosphatase)